MRSRLVALVFFLLVGVMVGPANASGFFTDDDGSVHVRSIEAIAAAGITRGCNPPDNTMFCPKDAVTREQMATFLVRALGLPAGSASFTDIAGSVHEANIEALAAAGITRGCNPPDNTMFCPKDPVTREQMATFLARALDLDVSPRVVVTSSGDLIDVPLGTSETKTVSELTDLLGPPTGDETRGCPYFGPDNTRYVSWGSLTAVIRVVDSGDGVLGLVGWRYKLDSGGQPEAGGPKAEHIEMPFGLELGDPIGDAVDAGGGPLTVTPYTWVEVDFNDFVVEASGIAADPNLPIDGVRQGVGFDCE
jgi:S-layer homology domain